MGRLEHGRELWFDARFVRIVFCARPAAPRGRGRARPGASSQNAPARLRRSLKHLCPMRARRTLSSYSLHRELIAGVLKIPVIRGLEKMCPTRPRPEYGVLGEPLWSSVEPSGRSRTRAHCA